MVPRLHKFDVLEVLDLDDEKRRKKHLPMFDLWI
jgi:hypothetical protein